MVRKQHLFLFVFFVAVYCVSASSWRLPGSEILRWVVIGGLCFGGAINGRHFHLFPIEYYLLLTAFLLGIVCSIGKDNLFTGIQRTGSFFLLILGMYSYFRSEEWPFEKTVGGIIVFSRMLELLSIALFLYYFVSGQSIGYYYAIYSNPNYLAPIAVTAFGTSLLMFFREKGFAKFFDFLCICIASFLTIATGSRAGLLSLLVFFVFMPLILDTKISWTRFLKYIVFAIIIIAMLFFIGMRMNIPALDRLLSASNSVSSTGLSRGSAWEHGMELFKQKPILGWGSSAAYYYTFIDNTSGYNGWGTHSSYITILIDHGLIGAGLMFLFLATILKRMWHSYTYIWNKADMEDIRTVLALGLIAIALLVDAAAESFLFAVGNFSAVCFWVAFCFIDLYLSSLEETIDYQF